MPRPQSAATRARLELAAKVKGNFFDRAKIKRMFDDMTRRSLAMAGLDVQQASKKGIGNVAPKQTKAGARAVRAGEVVEFVGGLYRNITMLNGGKPRPAGKPVKSWAPRRFLYRDIRFYLGRGLFGPTAVIGPQKAEWLNRLHEFGGTVTQRAFRMSVGKARIAYLRRREGRSFTPDDTGLLVWSTVKPRGRKWESTSITRIAKYPARPFMQGAAGVQKAAARANEKFRNQLRKAS